VTRNRFAGEPFDDSDAVIAGALAEVSVPALLCSLVHMTGDLSWVRGDLQPNVGMSLDIQGAMSEEDMAEVRRRATREGGCYQHVQAIIVSIDQYAEAALGNREYFLNKPYGIGGSRRGDDIP